MTSRAGLRAGALAGGCLVLAALTLLAPSAPSYDPFAWIVWGRELVTPAATFSVSGGPSWKPLPVLFTALFSFAGGAAPALWLLVARAGALAALAGAYAVGARLAGRQAGALAMVGVLLLEEFASLAWRGASEPLLLACVLWAVERGLVGRRSTAFALGVAAALIRPEVVPFLAVYAVVCWHAGGASERWLLVGGLALLPLLWLGIPALGGDPFAASSTATADGGAGQVSAWTALRRGLSLPLWPVWPLAALAGLSHGRPAGSASPGAGDRPASERSGAAERHVRVLLAGAVAWLALVVAMTAAGYSGVGRYMLPAAAVASVLAAVGAVDLWDRLARAPRLALASFGVVAVVVGLAAVAERATTLDDQVRDGIRVAHARDDLRAAIDAAGGAAALKRCALGGWIAINHTAQSTLAWELAVPLDRAARTMSRPGLEIAAPRSGATGAPPPVTLRAPRTSAPVAHAGAWRVTALTTAGAPLPPACSPAGGVRPRAQNHQS